MDLLPKNVIEETLHVYITKLVDTHAAAEGSYRSVLDSSFFMSLIATLFKRKTDTEIDEEKYSVAFTSKEAMDASKTFADISKLLPCRTYCRREERAGKMSSKCCLKCAPRREEEIS